MLNECQIIESHSFCFRHNSGGGGGRIGWFKTNQTMKTSIKVKFITEWMPQCLKFLLLKSLLWGKAWGIQKAEVIYSDFSSSSQRKWKCIPWESRDRAWKSFGGKISLRACFLTQNSYRVWISWHSPCHQEQLLCLDLHTQDSFKSHASLIGYRICSHFPWEKPR